MVQVVLGDAREFVLGDGSETDHRILPRERFDKVFARCKEVEAAGTVLGTICFIPVRSMVTGSAYRVDLPPA